MKQTPEEHRLVRCIKPSNILSFPCDNPALELENLNVFIGPNGAGKSNLIETLALMRATPVQPQTTSSGDIRGVIRRGGGVNEWIWKGAKDQPASVELIINNPQGRQALRHLLSFRNDEQGFRLYDEFVENEKPYDDTEDDAYFYYRFQDGHPVINTISQVKHKLLHDKANSKTPFLSDMYPINNNDSLMKRKLTRETVNFDLSILAQRRDPEFYPEITYLADTYEKWRIYREWSFGRNTVFREPQKADMRNDRLEEDFSNLGLFLSRLRKTPKAKNAILSALKELYDGLTDFDIIVEGGSVQVFFSEGDFFIPATRLSDGTLRYLCLLAILCDPTPPPLICIEEPELGLHPDIMPKLADLLIDASERTQLIVTTHSEILVDALTKQPETVVVCEKHSGKTTMKRLDKEELSGWLEKYRLGQLWLKGQLGGTRW
ncbi:MAG: AAA family ATPase [Victivallales bacterium]